MAWSGFGQTHLAWKQAGVQKSSGPDLVERNRNATSFSLSDSAAFFHRRSGSYCAKPASIQYGSGWLCQVLAKRIRSGSKPVCLNHRARFWPTPPSRSGSDANSMRCLSVLFTVRHRTHSSSEVFTSREIWALRLCRTKWMESELKASQGLHHRSPWIRLPPKRGQGGAAPP